MCVYIIYIYTYIYIYSGIIGKTAIHLQVTWNDIELVFEISCTLFPTWDTTLVISHSYVNLLAGSLFNRPGQRLSSPPQTEALLNRRLGPRLRGLDLNGKGESWRKKKRFYRQNHPRVAMTQSYFPSRRIWKWRAECSAPVCLENICSRIPEWILRYPQVDLNKFRRNSNHGPMWISCITLHELLMISKSAHEGIQNVSTSWFVRHASFQQIHCFTFLTISGPEISGVDKASFDSSNILRYSDQAPDVTHSCLRVGVPGSQKMC